MVARWRMLVEKGRFALRIVLAFAIARVVAGLIIIAFFSRESLAWGYEITVVIAAAVILSVFAALAVRRWAPPRSR